jgi:hypothetical protein
MADQVTGSHYWGWDICEGVSEVETVEIGPRPRRKSKPLPSSVSRKLSPVERERIMWGERRGVYVALVEAEATIRLKKEYRRLVDAIYIFEITAKRPIRKIIDAIPERDKPEVAKRVKKAWRFISKLRDELMPYENSRKLSQSDDDKRTLAELLRRLKHSTG